MTKNILKDNPLKNKGLLLVNKPAGKTSFHMVAMVRRRLGVRKVGHAGTLDPFATGLLILLVGREYTALSDKFLNSDKEYVAHLELGSATDTHDTEGKITHQSDLRPSYEEVEAVVAQFQGEMEQIPPMFSAKKVNGQKLYHLARKGQVIERKPVKILLTTELLDYTYPTVSLRINCSKGTYVRSIAHDMGTQLGCFAHLNALERTRCGHFSVDEAVDGARLLDPDLELSALLRKDASVSSQIAVAQ